jgi:SAM-dependent methyltransferase
MPLSETQLLDELRALQMAFTQNREGRLFKEYMLDPKKVSAYASFYLPTNMPKFHGLWSNIKTEDQETIRALNFVDIGSGPGTYSLAFLQQYNQDYAGVIRLIDHSPLMLEQARKILLHFYPNVQVQCYESVFAYLKQNFDPAGECVFFGHSLNEMDLRHRQEIFKRKPRAVLWIEPGTPQVFHDVIQHRGELLSSGYECLYPCLSGSACPAMKLGEAQWCHQSTWSNVPPELHRVAQILELNRHHLPMLSHAYLNNDNHRHEPKTLDLEARVVRKRKETKHSFEWEVCAFMDGRLEWVELSIPKKTMSKDDCKNMEKIDLGKRCRFEIIKEMAANSYRVRLIDVESIFSS